MAKRNNRVRSSVVGDDVEINKILDEEFNPVKMETEKPPIYFVPTSILCVCGQRVLVNDPTSYMSVTVMCTNPNCSQENLEKKIDLTKFAFTEYELL